MKPTVLVFAAVVIVAYLGVMALIVLAAVIAYGWIDPPTHHR